MSASEAVADLVESFRKLMVSAEALDFPIDNLRTAAIQQLMRIYGCSEAEAQAHLEREEAEREAWWNAGWRTWECSGCGRLHTYNENDEYEGCSCD